MTFHLERKEGHDEENDRSNEVNQTNTCRCVKIPKNKYANVRMNNPINPRATCQGLMIPSRESIEDSILWMTTLDTVGIISEVTTSCAGIIFYKDQRQWRSLFDIRYR